jgi:hypothetical protein
MNLLVFCHKFLFHLGLNTNKFRKFKAPSVDICYLPIAILWSYLQLSVNIRLRKVISLKIINA